MTVAAARDVPVLGMAGNTGDAGMLALASGPDRVDAGMATLTVAEVHFAFEFDLQRLMHRVTGHTGIFRLIFEVAFMTFEAARDISMLGVVTGAAGHLGVLAGKVLDL